MSILLWLLPAALVTVLAMVVVAVTGREDRESHERTEAELERMGAALSRKAPGRATAPRPNESLSSVRVTGRRRSPQTSGDVRRSA